MPQQIVQEYFSRESLPPLVPVAPRQHLHHIVGLVGDSHLGMRGEEGAKKGRSGTGAPYEERKGRHIRSTAARRVPRCLRHLHLAAVKHHDWTFLLKRRPAKRASAPAARILTPTDVHKGIRSAPRS